VGRNTEKPTNVQIRWMAKLLSAVGFSSPKWIHLLKGATGEPRETEKEEMPLNDDILDSIVRLLYIRHPAKNSTHVCIWWLYSIICEQERPSRAHFQDIYWRHHVVCTQQQTITDMSQHDHLGSFIIGQQSYEVYNQPADNSCFFHSFSSMLYPKLQENTPGAVELKSQLLTFYSGACDPRLQEALQQILHLDFLERARSLGHKGYWGDLNDGYALASLYFTKSNLPSA